MMPAETDAGGDLLRPVQNFPNLCEEGKRGKWFGDQIKPFGIDPLAVDYVGRVAAHEQRLHIGFDDMNFIVCFLPVFSRHDDIQKEEPDLIAMKPDLLNRLFTVGSLDDLI